MEDKDLEKDIKDFNPDDDLDLFFNDFIKKGRVEKEGEVVPGLRVRLKVLNTGELVSAEALMRMSSEFPPDVVVKIRGASILSQAILSINNYEIEKENMEIEQIKQRRSKLYRQLLEMPAYVVQKTYELYLDAVIEQNKFYSEAKETAGKIKNF